MKQKITSIEKALKVLLAFLPSNQEMGTMEISKKLGLHKTTASRILLTLTEHGFLQKNPRTKKFSLGSSIARLSYALKDSLRTNLVEISKPYLDRLRDETKESVAFEVLSGSSTVIAYIAQGPRRVRLAGRVGDLLPMHAAAGAKAIIAFLPANVARSLIGEKLERFTDNTITDPRKLLRELEEIREAGVSFDIEEIDEGTFAIGCPVFDSDNRPVAAIVIAGPVDRIKRYRKRLIGRLKDTASKISDKLRLST